MLPLKKCHFTLQNLTLGLRNFFYVKILRQIRCRHHWYTVYQKEINPVLLLCRLLWLKNMIILTLYNVILGIARNFLETRENVKISTHPFYHTNLDWFSWEWSKKKFFFDEKNSKWLIFQNGHFSKSPILEIFSRKFHRLVLGLVELIDAKAINVAQPIWSWGCLT